MKIMYRHKSRRMKMSVTYCLNYADIVNPRHGSKFLAII